MRQQGGYKGRSIQQYEANAGGEFDGVTSTGTALVATITPSKAYKGTVSLWFKLDDLHTASFFEFYTASGVSEDNNINMSSTGILSGTHKKLSETVRLSYTTASGFLDPYDNDGKWHHLIHTWDYDGGIIQIYIDDIEVSPTVTNPTGSAPDGSADTSGLGATSIFRHDGGLSEVWCDTDYALDLSVKANRRKFISSTKRPVFLGSNGSKPSGTQPEVYLKGVGTGFNVNSGSLGNYTTLGTLTTPPTTPSKP